MLCRAGQVFHHGSGLPTKTGSSGSSSSRDVASSGVHSVAHNLPSSIANTARCLQLLQEREMSGCHRSAAVEWRC
jgi:hypothetical protein